MRKYALALLIVALVFVVPMALAQDPTPGDPNSWPPIGDVLGGLSADILTALAPVLAAPITVAAIALIKFVLKRWLDPDENVSGEAISIVVAVLVYGGWLIAQYTGNASQFVSLAPILAVAFEGLRNVLVLLFGQQVLYLGARRLNVPVFGYSRTLPPSAKQAA